MEYQLLAVLFFIGYAYAQSVKVIDDTGAAYTGVATTEGDGCCSAKAKQYIEKGKKNNVKYCAVLFEDAACHSCKKLRSGWDEGIQQGKRTFPKFDLSGNSRFREDSESVIVAPGCIFVGYDESEPETDESKRAQERRTIASAIGRSDWVYKEFTVCIYVIICKVLISTLRDSKSRLSPLSFFYLNCRI